MASHLPGFATRHRPVEAVTFIRDDHRIVLIAPALSTAPESYLLEGSVLTLYGPGGQPMRRHFQLGDQSAVLLRENPELTVAEIDDQGPCRTTTNVMLREARA